VEVSSDGGQAESAAKVGRGRRRAIAAVVAVVLVVGGFGVWRLVDRDGSDGEVHVTGPGGVSTGPVLEWAEFDPALEDADPSGFFESLGDGRIIMRTYRLEGDEAELGMRFLVTENGFDWSEVPIPTGLWPPQFDLSGNRWLVAGYDLRSEPGSLDEDTEDRDTRVLAGYRAFYSDDQGANWTESEIDFSSSSIQVPTTFDLLPYFVTAALTSGDHMVIVLQGDENDTTAALDSDSTVASRSGQESKKRSKARIFASDGGAFEQVAEYDGSIYSGVIGGSFSTPAGFSLSLNIEDATEQAPARPYTLTSSDGRIWNESEGAGSLSPTAFGPDGSLWRTAWLGTGYGLHRFDREGDLTTEVALDNALPFFVAAGPSGLVVNAMTVPGRNLFAIPDQRIAKEGYELRLNEPEGGFSLWDLATGIAVHECGPEVLWFPGWTPLEGDCGFTYPEDDNADVDAEVLVFEDMRTGGELVSFTRGELLPAFPLWVITGLVVDSPGEGEQWMGWSADGAEWGWQTPADAFGIDPAEANEATVWLAVGDGFVLASVQQIDNSPPYSPSTRWFIAQVP